MSMEFKVVESPEPTRVGTSRAGRIIVNVTEIFDSTVLLYASTRLLQGEIASDIIEQNNCSFMNPKRWRVNMAHTVERSCIQQFKSVSLDILTEYWRKPIDIKESNLRGLGNGIFRFFNSDYFGSRRVICSFLWPEIGELPASPVVVSEPNYTAVKTLTWMHKHSPIIVPFTDADTVFIDAETEISYISDLMC